jgi:alkanesulfonate monooxygenase SsuD/methylene tetrahydromethanopterin reductase-like flavin-dependent oxidoreductase (luciferase family)
MNFYYFGGYIGSGQISRLEESHFSGVMFTYDATQGDIFTLIARDIKHSEKIKYLVAIRPYSISPQYLCMINKSINSIMPNRLQINLISGYIKDHEADFGGIIGKVNDLSSRVDRSNYMIEYIDEINSMPGNKTSKYPLDFYVSTTNEYVLKVVQKNKNKIILPYRDYKNGYWMVIDEHESQFAGPDFKLGDTEVMLAVTPIIRKTKEELDLLGGYAKRPVWRKGEKSVTVNDVGYFTYEEFDDFVTGLEADGINHMLINAVPHSESDGLIDFIKHYKELKGTKPDSFIKQ